MIFVRIFQELCRSGPQLIIRLLALYVSIISLIVVYFANKKLDKIDEKAKKF